MELCYYVVGFGELLELDWIVIFSRGDKPLGFDRFVFQRIYLFI